jgi:hypothetical protein
LILIKYKVRQNFSIGRIFCREASFQSLRTNYLSLQNFSKIILPMRLRTLVCLALLAAASLQGLHAQATLFAEDFNACILPAGWEVNIAGNQNAVWYVDDACQNDDNNGESMNGSCFLFIDDDAVGDNTPPFVIDFVSPAFDLSQNSTTELSVDIHYRDWFSGQESFKVILTDGTAEWVLKTYTQFGSTGDSIGEYQTLKYDLSLYSQSPNARLIFRYDDAGGYNWWAGVDNIEVKGYGTGTNVLVENFDGCTKPDGWQTQILTGDYDWEFGLLDSSVALSNGNSMNGSCFAYFDDDILGQGADYSIVRLATPWFDGTDFSTFELNFDLILRYYLEKIAVIVEHDTGEEFIVQEYSDNVGGPYFPNYERLTLDLSPYRGQQMRVIFEYDDGNDWGWWAGIDNVKITGSGAGNDVCANALPLLTGDNCLPGNNQNAVFDGPQPSCSEKSVGSLWYRWQADFTGIAQLATKAQFNDVVNVFTGTCNNSQVLICDNRDEHGFVGETTRFDVQAGTSYLLRVSGQDVGFGIPRGPLCIGIAQVPSVPTPPANDLCANAQSLAVNGNCLNGSNLHATNSPALPSLNERARADVWYTFVAPTLAANQKLEIKSNANFADIITVYTGGCNALSEIAGNHKGGTLELNSVTAGQTYRVQIAGNFATIEGSLCPQVAVKQANAPANDDCLAAINVPLGGQCTAGNNLNASTSGYTPSCVPSVARDIWFKFVAPASGSVRINSGADFPHILAIWKGNCNGLEQVLCAENPLRCEGYLLLGSLAAGQTYYVQIASQIAATGPTSGGVCVKILNGSAQPDFEPLQLNVSENCIGEGFAVLSFDVSGGQQPYTYQGNPEGEALPTGTPYLVAVTDAMGCVQSLSGIVVDCATGICELATSFTPQQILCHGSSTGALQVNVNSGLAPYTYQWSTGATTQSIANLAAATYTVVVTDALGCTLSSTLALSEPAALSIAPSSIEQPTTGQSNGAIFVDIAGGTAPYTQAWYRDGVLFSSTEDLTAAPAGQYQLRVSDANGCTMQFDYTLTESVGTQNPSERAFAEIFPNPAKERAYLSVALPQAQTLFLTLSDGAGRALRTWSVDNVAEQTIPIDLKNLPTGAYQLRIVTNRETLSRKVVVAQ